MILDLRQGCSGFLLYDYACEDELDYIINAPHGRQGVWEEDNPNPLPNYPPPTFYRTCHSRRKDVKSLLSLESFSIVESYLVT